MNRSKIAGLTTTALFHLCLMGLFFETELQTPEPTPHQMEILIEFEEEEFKPSQAETGREPRQEIPKPDEEIKLVQKAEAQETGTKPQAGEEVTMGDEGDVEKFEPEREKPIDKRALFSSKKNHKDTIGAQTARKPSDKLKEGHPDGNTLISRTDGEPVARLKGRSTVGKLPKPVYNENENGIVVVTIRVDREGNVTDAKAGAKGTTTSNRKLWAAAEKAAKAAKFTSSTSEVQIGTITYVFRLK